MLIFAAQVVAWVIIASVTRARAREVVTALVDEPDVALSPAAAVSECRVRATSGLHLRDFVVTMMAASKRHEAVRAHLSTWLLHTRVLVTSDAPLPLRNNSLHRFVPMPGRARCLG